MEPSVHCSMDQGANSATSDIDYVNSHVRTPGKLEGEKDRARGRVWDRGTKPEAAPRIFFTNGDDILVGPENAAGHALLAQARRTDVVVPGRNRVECLGEELDGRRGLVRDDRDPGDGLRV